MTFLTDATIWLAPARNLFTSVSKSGVNDDRPSDPDAIVGQLRGSTEEDLDSLYIAEVLRSRFYVRHLPVAWLLPQLNLQLTDRTRMVVFQIGRGWRSRRDQALIALR